MQVVEVELALGETVIGEGLFLATLQGTGTVYLQSLPFSRLADRILVHAPAGGSSKGRVRCSAVRAICSTGTINFRPHLTTKRKSPGCYIADGALVRGGGVRLTLRAKLRRPYKRTGGHSGGVAEPTFTDSGNEALSFHRKALGRLGPALSIKNTLIS